MVLALKDLGYFLHPDNYWVINIPLSAVNAFHPDKDLFDIEIVGFERTQLFHVYAKADYFFIAQDYDQAVYCNGFSEEFSELESPGFAIMIDHTK